jgi:hypothetical protein
MIIRESKEAFTFITQHDHANIAGEFFVNLKKDFVPRDFYESLKFAVYQHDRSWIIPDSEPIWDNLNKRPYDFVTYPENLKYHFYRIGIEQTDQVNSYAALLCSLHYASFLINATTEAGKSFYNKELQRQKHLMQRLNIINDTFLNYQLKILKFCDDLSLYVCLNKPGVEKKEEHPFFKDGFPNSAFFNDGGEKNIVASYANKSGVKFNCSPFDKKFDLKITFKNVLKADIKRQGLSKAFADQPWGFNAVKIG